MTKRKDSGGIERHYFGGIGEALAGDEQPKLYHRGVEANEAFAKAMCAAHPGRSFGTIQSPGAVSAGPRSNADFV